MGNLNGIVSLSGGLSTNTIRGTVSSRKSMSGGMSRDTYNPDYNELKNLPTINGVLVKGDLTQEDLHIQRGYDASYDEETETLTLSL